MTTSRRLAKEEGILAGISAGANVFAAIKIAKKTGQGKIIVVIIPDLGDRYLSTDLFNE
jgi:cysteine synthase A